MSTPFFLRRKKSGLLPAVGKRGNMRFLRTSLTFPAVVGRILHYNRKVVTKMDTILGLTEKNHSVSHDPGIGPGGEQEDQGVNQAEDGQGSQRAEGEQGDVVNLEQLQHFGQHREGGKDMDSGVIRSSVRWA